MKDTRKRSIAFLLSMCMAATMIVPAFADGNAVVSQSKSKQQDELIVQDTSESSSQKKSADKQDDEMILEIGGRSDSSQKDDLVTEDGKPSNKVIDTTESSASAVSKTPVRTKAAGERTMTMSGVVSCLGIAKEYYGYAVGKGEISFHANSVSEGYFSIKFNTDGHSYPSYSQYGNAVYNEETGRYVLTPSDDSVRIEFETDGSSAAAVYLYGDTYASKLTAERFSRESISTLINALGKKALEGTGGAYAKAKQDKLIFFDANGNEIESLGASSFKTTNAIYDKELKKYLAFEGEDYKIVSFTFDSQNNQLTEFQRDGKTYQLCDHNLTKHTQKAATCEEDGLSNTYYSCENCSRYFSDEACNNELSQDDVDGYQLDKLGHDYKTEIVSYYYHKKVCQRDGCGSETAMKAHNYGVGWVATGEQDSKGLDIYTHTCVDCGYTNTGVYHEEVPGTCLVNGYVEYWESVVTTSDGEEHIEYLSRNGTRIFGADWEIATIDRAHKWKENEWGATDTHHWIECEYDSSHYKADSHGPHTFVEGDGWTIDDEGHHTRTCTVCSHVVIKDHEGTWNDNGDGTHSRTCTVCGAEEKNISHDYGDGWFETKDKNETSIHKHVCVDCGYSFTAQHKWANGVCTVCKYPCPHTDETGMTCSVCGQDIHKHEKGTEHPAVSATCMAAGTVKYWDCTREDCAVKLDEEGSILSSIVAPVDPDKHSWSTRYSTDKNEHWKVCKWNSDHESEHEKHSGGTATCKEKAECETCGAEYGKLTDHDWDTDNAVVLKKATCLESGIQTVSCKTDATHIKNVTIPVDDKNGHDWSKTWQNDSDGHWKLCKLDDQHESEPEEHTFGDWNEEHEHSCTVCGYTEACEHSFGDWSESEDGENHIRTCGTCGYEENAQHSFGDWTSVEGGHKQTCSVCGSENTDDHNYSEWTPDANDKTKHTRSCDVCGDIQSEAHSGGTATCQSKAECESCGAKYGEKSDHTWGDGEVTTEPTCSERGKMTYLCTIEDCGATKTEKIAIDPDAHSWSDTLACDTDKHWTLCVNDNSHTKDEAPHGSWKDGKCGTCGYACPHTNETGKICSVCGETTHKHELGENHPESAATCVAAGTVEYWDCTDQDCDVKLDKDGNPIADINIPIDEDAHDWDNGETTTPATCSAKGEMLFTCKRSSAHTKTEEIEIDEDAHDWDDGTVITPSTCSAKGEKELTCTLNPKHTKKVEIDIDENAHDWDEGQITVSATCSAKGVKTFTCKFDSEHTKTEDVDIDEDAHDWQNTWSSDAADHWKVCKLNDEHLTDKEAHAFTDWDENGKRSCTVCGYEETCIHDYGEWKPDVNGKHSRTCPTCGSTESKEHSYGEWSDSDPKPYYTCGDCGYVDETRREEIENTCHYDEIVDIQEGTFHLYINGTDLGEFTIARFGSGWSIQLSDGTYLAAENDEPTLSAEPFAWEWKNNCFCYTVQSKGRTSSWFWIFGRGTTFYLNADGEKLSISTSSDKAKAELHKRSVSSEHQYGSWTNNGNGTHTRICKGCGKSLTENCKFNESTHECLCGAFDSTAVNVEISATVTKKVNVYRWFWFTWYKKTTYKAVITTKAVGTKVKTVEYSTDGGHTWKKGSSFTSGKDIKKFDVRVTDTNGKQYFYSYPS